MGYFHPLEVVGRGSETQPQVGEQLTLEGLNQCLTCPGKDRNSKGR